MIRYLTLLGVCFLFFACNEQTQRKEGFGMHGIDVSHYQKKIDWEKVADQAIQFAFVKATEGETLRDSFYCRNWTEMKAAGIKRGAYHFFHPKLSASKQADNFIQATELGHNDLAPVLDVEVLNGLSSEELRIQVKTWLQIVEDHFKIKPILYTNQKFFNQHLAGHFENYPIWVARYSSWRKPNLRTGQKWKFWQYGSRGKLEGIDGPVDFNVFQGSKKEMDELSLVRPLPLLQTPPPAPVDGSVAVSP